MQQSRNFGSPIAHQFPLCEGEVRRSNSVVCDDTPDTRPTAGSSTTAHRLVLHPVPAAHPMNREQKWLTLRRSTSLSTQLSALATAVKRIACVSSQDSMDLQPPSVVLQTATRFWTPLQAHKLNRQSQYFSVCFSIGIGNGGRRGLLSPGWESSCRQGKRRGVVKLCGDS